MNGKQAKKLRRIARELSLDPETTYAPVGALRRIPDRVIDGKTYKGGLVRRPFAMRPCARRAYQEAKSLYTGKAVDDGSGREFKIGVAQRPFSARHVESMQVQPDGPVA